MIQKLISENSHNMVIQVLNNNGVVIYPCDTIYGFIGKIGKSEHAIRLLKGREEKKPFLLLSTLSIADSIAKKPIPEEIRVLWPGPLTVIMESKEGGTVALRVPDEKRILDIIQAVGCPIYSTSVNEAGEKPMNNIQDITHRYEKIVPLIIDGGNITNSKASTLLDITSKPFRIVREGEMYVPDEYLR